MEMSSIPSPHPLHIGLTPLDESENGLNPVLGPGAAASSGAAVARDTVRPRRPDPENKKEH
jgi:hypothetical protein